MIKTITGTDEKAIIQVLAKRSNEQRVKIARVFKVLFNKDLTKELKGDLSGNFEDVIVGLMTPKEEYDATIIHNAVKVGDISSALGSQHL